jgi:two-component system KDP operon response regulator KdpE
VTRVLVIDDEPSILRAVTIALSAHGFEVDVAATAKQALVKASGSSYAVIILDLGLPDLDGMELLRRLRELDRVVPILVLSAWQELETRVAALDEGADDFVPKPFGMPELLARIRVALRHARRGGTVPLEEPQLRFGELVIDTATRSVAVRGAQVELTRTQYQLLLFLARNPERVLTHQMIADNVWGPETHVEPENIRVVVSQLRKRIEVDSSDPHVIVTELGVGYRFLPPPTA